MADKGKGPRDAKIGDNGAEEAAQREAEANQLLSFVTRIKAQMKNVVKTKDAYDAQKSILKGIYKLADSLAGFKKGEIDEYLEKLAQPTTLTARQEERRARHFTVLRIPTATPEQGDLFQGAVDSEKPAMGARMDGYRAFLAGEPCQTPGGMNGDFIPHWTQGWHDAETATAFAMRATKAPKGDGKPAAGDKPKDDKPEAPKTPVKGKTGATPPPTVDLAATSADAMAHIRGLDEPGLIQAFNAVGVPIPKALTDGDLVATQRKLFVALGYDLEDFDASPAELKRAGESRA